MRAGSRDELLASLAKITFPLSPPFLLLLPLLILLLLLLLILLLRLLLLQKEAATFSLSHSQISGPSVGMVMRKSPSLMIVTTVSCF